MPENMFLRQGDRSSSPTKDKSEAGDGSRRVITTVFVALFIDLLGFTIILPLLPSILEHYSRNNVSRNNLLKTHLGKK